jgi:membrane fusion protein, multidrug efflux system
MTPRRLTRLATWLIGAGLAAASLAWWLSRDAGAASTGTSARTRMSQAATLVTVATARRGDMPVTVNGLGTVTAYNSVTIRSRVDGQLMRVAFTEGQTVKEGDLLAEIDPRPFQVQLTQAEGNLARDKAQLANANVDLARYRSMIGDHAIPQQQLDTQLATVAQLEGTVNADDGAVASAKLQLTYCRITSPLAGRVGLRLVDPGNIVHAADANGLLVITQVEPIAVLFAIPEDALPPVLKALQAGQKLVVDAYNRDDTTKLATGTLETTDNAIDQTTGTVRLKAVFANTDRALFPNQFVNAHLQVEVQHDRVLVPSAAIQQGAQGSFVYVVQDGRTHLRTVTLGASQHDVVSIAHGLDAGEQVVIDGLDTLRDGSRVEVHTQQPAPSTLTHAGPPNTARTRAPTPGRTTP